MLKQELSQFRKMEHDAIRYEIERLKEIYSLLFPEIYVKIFLKIVNFEELSGVQQIQYHDTVDLLEIRKNLAISIDLNKESSRIPEHIFIVTFCPKKQINNCIKDLKIYVDLFRKLFACFKQIVSRRFILLYEELKSIFLLKKENVDFQEERLINPWGLKNIRANKKQNVLFFFNWLDVGGAESFGVDCCALAARAGKTIYVISSNNSRPFYWEKIKKNGYLYEVWRQIPKALIVKFILALVSENNISLIHNHHSMDFYESLPTLRALDADIITVDSLHIDEKRRYGLGYPRISSVWSDYIDFHHVISRRLEKFLIDRGVCSNKICLGYLIKNKEQNSCFTLKENIRKKKIKLCFVGRFVQQKRPMLAFSMFKWAIWYFHKNGFKIEIDVIGDGPYFQNFKEALESYKLVSVFNLYSSTSNVNKIMIENDILLISSENEGIALVGYEAYRNGVLVVSTDVGAQCEIIPDTLLLSSQPIKAYFQWKRLLQKLLFEPEFVEDVIGNFCNKMKIIYDLPSAESVITDIYGVKK